MHLMGYNKRSFSDLLEQLLFIFWWRPATSIVGFILVAFRYSCFASYKLILIWSKKLYNYKLRKLEFRTISLNYLLKPQIVNQMPKSKLQRISMLDSTTS